MLENFIFSASSALPIFLVMLAGFGMKRWNIIDDGFVRKGNQVVFLVALPLKLFMDVSTNAIGEYFDLKFLLYIVLGTILSAGVAYGVGRLAVKDNAQLGAFVHGTFRGNFLYVGLSLMENVTGRIGLKTPLAIAFIIPLYNILGVVVLSLLDTHREQKVNLGEILRKIVTNPFIVAVALGMVFSLTGGHLPVILTRTFTYFSNLATPLALIAIGASFRRQGLARNWGIGLLASFVKLLLLPGLAVLGGIYLGFSAEDLLLIYIIFGVPTATTTFVITTAMHGDGDLASNIILFTTILANFSMTLFIFVFRLLGYV